VSSTYIGQLRDARQRPAVLKYDFVTLRGRLPDVLIFAFEGDDDKIVYSHWIRRIRPELAYEPFPCKGKRNVLQLREMLKRDANNLSQGVYFFIDKDFDGLCGYDYDIGTFITTSYSIENYLVNELVLSEFLKNEFHCHAQPDVRQAILDGFNKLYTDFLTAAKAINFRIFVARLLEIRIVNNLPKKVTIFLTVELDKVTITDTSAESIVPLEREPTTHEIDEARGIFDRFNPVMDYRGKFAFDFFRRWVLLLAQDYQVPASRHFNAIDRTAKVRIDEMKSIGSFAAKSILPEGLSDFIRAIPMPAR
jgi:hypothetical protein